jgi:hypothetical protein
MAVSMTVRAGESPRGLASRDIFALPHSPFAAVFANLQHRSRFCFGEKTIDELYYS